VNRRENGHVTGFDAATGQQLWDLPFDSERSKLSPPTIGGGRAAVVSGPHVLSIDLASGQVAWTERAAPDNKLYRAIPYSRPAPAIAGNSVCVSIGTEFHVFDMMTGKRIGKRNYATGGGLAATPVAADGTCYFATSAAGDRSGFSGSTDIVAVDPMHKAKPFWSQRIGKDLRDLGASNVALNDSTVFVATNYRVAAYDKKSGKKKWMVEGGPVYPVTPQRGTRTHHAGGGWFGGFGAGAASSGVVFNDTPGTNFIVTNTHVAIPASDNKRDVVTILDAATGAYLGSLDVGNSTVTDLATAPDGTLVVATTEGLKTAKLDSFVAGAVPIKK
jgi:outer membrane protein assembly factor BamB